MDNTDISVLRGKKTGFLSLGCKVNSYETDRMREQFALAGAVICDFDTPGADIIIVNTCSVTNIADRKSRQMLHKARHLSPNALIAAVGCYAQAKGSEIVEAGDADICVGNSSKDRVLQLVAGEMMRRNARKTDAGSDKDIVSIEKTSEGIKDTTGQSMTASEYDALSLKQAHTRAFVKIQDGLKC